MVSEDRRIEVLRAIVEDYVQTREPVGSRVLVERHRLGVSPATIRNDMAALEESGYITQPHTSAGRVPTDKGYRLFVDKLARIKPLSGAERNAITSFMNGTADVDDLVMRTVRLLAQLTRQVAIVQYPVAQHAQVRHVELVSLTPERLMVIVVQSSGRVDQTVLEAPTADEPRLHALRMKLAAATIGYFVVPTENGWRWALAYDDFTFNWAQRPRRNAGPTNSQNSGSNKPIMFSAP